MNNKINWRSIGEWRYNPDLVMRKIFKDPLSDCWLWIGAHGPMGALFGARKNGKAQMTQASRIVYMEHTGQDVGAYELRHTCNNVRCVNPDHIALYENRKNRTYGRSKNQ